jgi:catechol 2,3-dioxygenase-like lactoylglutathione lyase family enzyme
MSHSLYQGKNENTMLSHVSIGVSDLERSTAFYDAVFAALGFVRVWTGSDSRGWGVAGGGDRFAIKREAPGERLGSSPRSHIAFAATTREAVVAFHQAGLGTGGTDQGPPGLRPHYGPDYYAAFLRDPGGHDLEAVCQAGE